MEREVAWKKYTAADNDALEALAADYIDFISANKTERECAASAIAAAEDAGYDSLADCIAAGTPVGPGSKLWACAQGKAVVLVHVGAAPLSEGLNILGAHIDSPRLDIKQNPLYEANDFALLDTHYYGGIKNYQWTALPLALHGVVATTGGEVVEVNIGEDPADPVFCVTDLLPHLGAQQMDKKGSKVVEGEDLDVLVGNRPLAAEDADADADAAEAEKTAEVAAAADTADAPADEAAKDPVKAMVLSLLADKYGITEEDFLSAELEVVPAGCARDLGFDRSMVIGYGQDDRVCAYTSLTALLHAETPGRTLVCVLADKEETGSGGTTGMNADYWRNLIAGIARPYGVDARQVFANSKCLSADVNIAFDPTFPEVHEKMNVSFANYGVVLTKYTGARGKAGTSDASAEFTGEIQRMLDANGVLWQTGNLGKVDQGGGGTVAGCLAQTDIDTIDIGVPVLSMHAPLEVAAKIDVYSTYRAFCAFAKHEG